MSRISLNLWPCTLPSPKGGPAADATEVVELAPKGQKPAGIVANVLTLKAQVVAIDYEARTVSLKGPAGNVRILKIGPEAKNFDKVKKGGRCGASLHHSCGHRGRETLGTSIQNNTPTIQPGALPRLDPFFPTYPFLTLFKFQFRIY